MNNRCKKSKLKFHGYYIACGIDIAIYIAKITDKNYIFKKILKWYELNKKYIELSNLLTIKEYNFEEYNNKIDNINFNFIIKFSSIKEKELIKNKKKKYNSIKLKK